MKVFVNYRGDSTEIVISGFPEEEAEEIMRTIRRIFMECVTDEE